MPVGLDADHQHRGDGPLDHVEDRSVDRVPALRGLEVPRPPQSHGARRRPKVILGDEHGGHQVGDFAGLRCVLDVHPDFPFGGADPAHRQQIRDGKERFPLFPFGVHRVDKLITALPLIADLKGLLFSERGMDKEARGAAGLEHGTVAGVLWQKGALGFAARPNTDSGPVRFGKESYFHRGIIASPKTRDVPRPWAYRLRFREIKTKISIESITCRRHAQRTPQASERMTTETNAERPEVRSQNETKSTNSNDLHIRNRSLPSQRRQIPRSGHYRWTARSLGQLGQMRGNCHASWPGALRPEPDPSRNPRRIRRPRR